MPERKSRFGLTAVDLGLLGIPVVWGVNYAVIKAALLQFQPMAFNGVRFALATVTIGLLLRHRGTSLRMPREGLWRLALLGVLGNAVYQLLFIEGISRTSAANASLIMASSPMLVALLATALGRERLRRRGWLGVVLAVAGLTLVLSVQDLDGFTRVGLSGDLLVLAAATTWALYTVLASNVMARTSSLSATMVTFLSGTPVLLLMAVPSLVSQDWRRIGAMGWLGVAFSGDRCHRSRVPRMEHGSRRRRKHPHGRLLQPHAGGRSGARLGHTRGEVDLLPGGGGRRGPRRDRAHAQGNGSARLGGLSRAARLPGDHLAHARFTGSSRRPHRRVTMSAYKVHDRGDTPEGGERTMRRHLTKGIVDGGRSSAALLLAGAASAQIASLYYQEVTKDGRIYVFNTFERFQAFQKTGEMGTSITLIGRGPNGETVVAENETAIDLFLFKHNLPAYDRPTPPPPKPLVPTTLKVGDGEVKFGMLLQGWYVADDSPASTGSSWLGNTTGYNTFRLRRSEIKLSGKITPDWAFEVMLDPAKSQFSGTGPAADSKILQDLAVTYVGLKGYEFALGQKKIYLTEEGARAPPPRSTSPSVPRSRGRSPTNARPASFSRASSAGRSQAISRPPTACRRTPPPIPTTLSSSPPGSTSSRCRGSCSAPRGPTAPPAGGGHTSV